ncbi:MAG: type I methionyl aminopeptidase [bacterium]
MSRLKTEQEIENLQQGGHILAGILNELVRLSRPGVSTEELDKQARALMKQAQVESAFFGYRGYPGAICTSINHQVVHGIPDQKTVLREGDVLSIDIGIKYKNLITDMARTIPIGRVSQSAEKLISTTKQALSLGIAAIQAGQPLGRVGAAVQEFAEQQGYGVVRDLSGHGVGHMLHEDPSIPNFGPASQGPIVQAGMVLAIEPMLTLGDWQVKTLDDGWTVVTADRKISAHFEHTIAVTGQGVKVLTK